MRDSLTQQPLPFATVFLVRTTLGTTTDAQGHFTLAVPTPGQYQLAATYVGYGLRQRPLTVAAGAAALGVDLVLPARSPVLGEVLVRPPSPARAVDYRRFQDLFLGTSTFARQCQVRNLAVLDLRDDPVRHQLTARAPTQPLVVDNAALGYRLTVYDLSFAATYRADWVWTTTQAQVVFTQLPGTAAAQRRWAANRQQAYHGSLAHFLRSCYAGQLATQGFYVQRLQRRPNRAWRQADSLLRARQAAGQRVGQADLPAGSWRHLLEAPTLDVVYPPRLPLDSVRWVDATGQVWLRFRDLLAVTYERARPDAAFPLPGAISGQRPPHRQESVLRLTPPPAAALAANGALRQPLAVVTEGYWSFEKVGMLLPLDYQPPSKP